MKHLDRRVGAVCLGLVMMATATAQEVKREPGKAPPNIRIEADVEYGKAGDRSLTLDLVLPLAASDKPRPVIVFVHGGAWRGGNKANGVGMLTPFVAREGYAGVSVGYRLSQEATWPAQIHDCKAAIRWIRAHAKDYGFDPDRIGVWGSSAGGHLVSMLGTSGDVPELEGANGNPGVSSRVACVVNFFGPSDLARMRHDNGQFGTSDRWPESLLIGGDIKDPANLAKAASASPVTFITKDDPPFLTLHGTDDQVVLFEQGQILHKTLVQAGVPSILVPVVGAGHGFGGPDVQQRVSQFFAKHLKGESVEVSDSPIKAPMGKQKAKSKEGKQKARAGLKTE